MAGEDLNPPMPDWDPDLERELAEDVQRGTLLLDHNAPGWWQKIDPTRLDMESCYVCVLGQLAKAANPTVTNPYDRGFRDYAFPNPYIAVFGPQAERHGFAVGDREDVNARYEILTALWRGVIVQRQLEARR